MNAIGVLFRIIRAVITMLRDRRLIGGPTETVIDIESVQPLTLSSNPLNTLERKIGDNWAEIAPPPGGYTKLDIVTLLLRSPGYSMSPDTFAWPQSTEGTYISLWYMVAKLPRSSTMLGFLDGIVAGRNSEGYSASRGINLDQGECAPTPLGDLPEIAEALRSWPADADVRAQDTYSEVSYEAMIVNMTMASLAPSNTRRRRRRDQRS